MSQAHTTGKVLAGTVGAVGLLLATGQAANAASVTVKANDTVWALAQEHGVSVKSIEKLNQIKASDANVDLIYVGQKLQVSGTATKSATKKVTAKGTYTVKAGDSLWTLADQYNTSVHALQQLNDLSGDLIVVGQNLQVPSATTKTTSKQSTTSTDATSASATTATSAASSSANRQSTSSSATESTSTVSQDAVSASSESSTSASSSSAATSAVSSTETVKAVATSASVTSQAATTESTDQVSSSTVTSSASQSSSVASSSTTSSVSQSSSTASVVATNASTNNTTAATSTASVSSSAASSTATSSAAQSSTSTSSASQSSTATTNSSSTTTSTTSDLATGSVTGLALKLASANIPYVWGGSSLSGMDCSGLVSYVYSHAAGISLPHSTIAQESYVTTHSVADAQPGDILFWGDRGSTYHDAIYIGNNQYVAAPTEGKNVQVETISSYFMPSFAGTVK
ncbi:C40 family peptidase [Lactiplantibacillus herbarum]|uniref:C40 family peptidase n=1 Tax=Lactiplantibacillus herbarum TaxID=1670446 RepID=UPI00064F2629|nr:C40 family peptidase [Lactiplantibacillus herbarum]